MIRFIQGIDEIGLEREGLFKLDQRLFLLLLGEENPSHMEVSHRVLRGNLYHFLKGLLGFGEIPFKEIGISKHEMRLNDLWTVFQYFIGLLNGRLKAPALR